MVAGARPSAAQLTDEATRLEECHNLPIAGLLLEGCRGYWCGEPSEKAKLLSLTDLRAGQTFDKSKVKQALTRLRQTGFFRDVQLKQCVAQHEKTRAFIVLAVRPNRWVHSIEIDGNQHLFESDILKRMFLKPGRPFNPTDETSEAERKRQEDLLRRRYQKEGFDEAKVTIVAVPSGSEGVDLTVRITEGPKKKVTAVDVVATRGVPAKAESIFGPEAQCPTFGRREIRLASGLKASDIFTRRKEKLTRRKTVAWLRSRGIVEPKVAVSYAAETGLATISVEYDRCYLIRFRSRHDPAPGRRGYIDADYDELAQVLTFGESGLFYLDEARRSRAALESQLQEQGYLFADVRLDYRRADLKRSAPGVHGVISYYITQGYRSEIRSITLRGTKHIKRQELLERLETRTYDFFGSGGYLLVDRMFGDLSQIMAVYHSRGFYRMRFPGAPGAAKRSDGVRVTRRKDGEDYVYDYVWGERKFSMRKHPKESVIYLEVDVDEGPQSRVGTVGVTGITGEWLTKAKAAMRLKTNDVYSPSVVTTDRLAIERYFQSLGHHEVTIETTCTAHGEGRDVLKKCDWKSVLARKVDIKHDVVPGATVTVGEVFVRGAVRTVRGLIRDPLPNTGELLDRFKLDEAERKIRQLGVFSSVDLKLVGLDQMPIRDRVAVIVSVHERGAKFLELLTGIEPVVSTESGQLGGTVEEGVPLMSSSVSNLIGVTDMAFRGPNQATPLNIPNLLFFLGTTFRHRNFLGRAMEFELPVRYGFSIPRPDTDVGKAFSRLAEVEPTIYEPHLFGTDVAVSVGVFGRYDTATRPEDQLEAGGKLTFSTFLFNRLRVALTFKGSGFRAGTDFPDELGELGEESLLQPKIDVDLSATLDYLDNPIHPTRGFAFGARIGYLFQPETISDTFANFVKLEGTARGAVSFRKFLVLAGYFRYATSFTEDRLPLAIEERYRLGGIFGLRGIEDGTVRPTDDKGIPDSEFEGGNSLLAGTVELRIPVLRREAFGLWLGAFFDWGGLSTGFAFESRTIRMTTGLGLRVLFSGIPIRIDVGFNVDPRCNPWPDGRAVVDSRGVCTNGKEDVFDTQFGLLYTF